MAKTTPKKSSPRGSHQARMFVHVEVLQNGATLLSTSLPLRHRGNLVLTSSGRGKLVLPHYPLTEGRLEFLKFTASGAELVVDYKWEGFCTEGGELKNITRGERGRRVIAMQKGDYASITYDDLRLMIRLAPTAPKPMRVSLSAKERASFAAHFFPTRVERLTGALAAAMTAVIVGGIVAGLMNRVVTKPTSLNDISEDYVLPFIAADHLKQAPEALQEQLNRRDEVHSVLGYYRALTSVLMGSSDYEPRYLFPTSIDRYHELYQDARKRGEEKLERQRAIDKEQSGHDNIALLQIPAVIGESLPGSMLRVIDKIDTVQTALAENLAAKRQLSNSFAEDPDYAWEEYKNPNPKDQKARDFLAQIKVFGQQTDEEMMYSEAEALAARARAKQSRIERHRESTGVLSAAGVTPIGMPDGVRFASFAGDFDFRMADDKLLSVQGSDYGAPRPSKKAVVREPLVGQIEPGLIEHYIKENRYQLQLCYELALRRNEGATGTMEWRWRVDSRGVISELALISSNIQDRRMSECVRQKISQWRFPRPRRGSVQISYPFEFAPAKG